MLIRPQRGSYIIEQVVRIKVCSSACWFRFDVWRFARLSFGLFGRLLSKITKWRNNRQQKVKVKYIAGASISHDTGVKSDCCLITVTQSNPIPPQAPWNGVKHPASVKKSSFIIRHMPYVFQRHTLLHANKRSLSRWIWQWCTSCWKYVTNALKSELS